MLDLIKIRKDLHRIPELALNEYKTQEYILSILKKYKNIKIITFDFTGILVEYTTNPNKSYKLFRADMDALPLSEKTEADFASKHHGIMHACGHDIHMTILLGLIDKILSEQIKSNFLFLFQPAEEAKGGAKRIIDTKILDNYNISEAYALHINGKYPVGTLSTKADIFFIATREIDIIIHGKSAHVAFPENGINALELAAKIYIDIKKEYASTKFDSITLCEFGKLVAGDVRNSIAEKALIQGTIRAAKDNDIKKIEQIIENIINNYRQKAKIEIIIKNPYKQVINDKNLYEKFKSIVKSLNYQFIEAKTEHTAEDFGYFSQLYPSLLFWLGGNSPYNLHSDKFLPDENAIFVGVKIMYRLAKL